MEQAIKDIKVKGIIAVLNEIDVDGETMQYILEEVNMDDQMLTQLIGCASRETVKGLLDHHHPQENDAENRLKLVLDDCVSLRRVLGRKDIDMSIEELGDTSISTLIANIEIACDMNDNESDNWKLHNDNGTHKKYHVPNTQPMITERELLNIIIVHTSRTWERLRVTRENEEMPLDNIQSVDSILEISEEILKDKILQEFLDPKEHENWDWTKKTKEGFSDSYIEKLGLAIINRDYFNKD